MRTRDAFSPGRWWLLVLLWGVAGTAPTLASTTNAAAQGGCPLECPPLSDAARGASGSVTGMVDRTWASISGVLLRGVARTDVWLDRLLTRQSDEHSHTLNRFFGDRRPLDAGRGSYIKITPYVEYSEDGVKLSSKFRGRLDLPRLKDRAQLVFDNMTDEQDPLSDVRTFTTRDTGSASENSETVALRVRFLDEARYDVDVSGGVVFDPEPIPEAKLRGRVKLQFDPWRLVLSETVFWDHDDEFGERTQFELGRSLGPRYAMRLNASAVYAEQSEGVEIGTTATLARKLSNRRTVSVTGGAGWFTHPDAVIDEYILRIPYRQLVYRNWVHIEVEPGLNVRNEDDWEPAPQIIFRFEMLFGDP